MLEIFSIFCRGWYTAVVAVSAVLALITLLSFPMLHHGVWSILLFEFGYAGENDVGAWWSGMLLLLSAVLALDGYMCAEKSPAERRGWLVLGAVLVCLSFDEIASVHEAIGLRHIVPVGLAGLAATSYALISLRKGGRSWKQLAIIIAAFCLFGTDGLQEKIQHMFVWKNEWIYGARAMLEEGTEVAGMLMLVSATRPNTARLLSGHRPDAFAAIERYRTPVLIAALVLVPVLTAATYVLPYPGGPADWLASSLYLLCVLLVLRRMLLHEAPATSARVALLLFYLAASAGSNAIKWHWDPAVFGTQVAVRGVFLALLLFASVPILRADGRRVGVWPIVAGALVLLGGAEWPESQSLWCFAPAFLAVGFFASESAAAAPATAGAASLQDMPSAEMSSEQTATHGDIRAG